MYKRPQRPALCGTRNYLMEINLILYHLIHLISQENMHLVANLPQTSHASISRIKGIISSRWSYDDDPSTVD